MQTALWRKTSLLNNFVRSYKHEKIALNIALNVLILRDP